jgi:ketosteroid isomerase-like protein
MRFSWLIATLLSVATVANGRQPSAEFLHLEEQWNAAHRNGDAKTLEKLWADDLEVDVPRMPAMSKGEALAFARTGRMRFDAYDTSQIKVRLYTEMAIVTGRLRRTRLVDGARRDDDWRFTKVYIRENGAWRVVSFHASDASAE